MPETLDYTPALKRRIKDLCYDMRNIPEAAKALLELRILLNKLGTNEHTNNEPD